MRLFSDRRAAAHELARHLTFLKGENPIVLGLVSSGVPMAEIIARSLDATLDVLLIERLSAPKTPEHIVGAVDEHGRISMIRSTARWHHLTSQQMVEPARDVFREVQRRRGLIRRVLPEMDVRNRTVIIVSQGVASGAKMLGAISSVRDRGARKVVVAAPAGSGEAAWQLHDAADLVVIPHRPAKFKSVEEFYEDSSPVPDELILAIIENWVKTRPQQQSGVQTLVLKIQNDLGNLICCEIDLPPGVRRGSGPFPAVIFAHGFESDGRNPRTVPISRRLAKRGIIGVRADFTGHGRSEGNLKQATPERMANDLRRVVSNTVCLAEVNNERIGLVGSGSGSALVVALAREEPTLRAAVVRGPLDGCEFAMLNAVKVPTLVICAEQDEGLVAASGSSATRPALPSCHEVLAIPDASRLFNDAISREMMIGASVDWLVDHLAPVRADEPGAPAPGPPADAGGPPAPTLEGGPDRGQAPSEEGIPASERAPGA